MDSAPQKKDKKPTNLDFLTDYVNQILVPLLHPLPLNLCLTARLPKHTPSIESRTTVCYVQLPTNASRRTYLLGIGLYLKVRMCPIITYVHVCTNRRYICFPSICNCLEKIRRQYEFTNFLDSYRRIGGHDQKIRASCAHSDTLVRKVQTYRRFQFFPALIYYQQSTTYTETV